MSLFPSTFQFPPNSYLSFSTFSFPKLSSRFHYHVSTVSFPTLCLLLTSRFLLSTNSPSHILFLLLSCDILWFLVGSRIGTAKPYRTVVKSLLTLYSSRAHTHTLTPSSFPLPWNFCEMGLSMCSSCLSPAIFWVVLVLQFRCNPQIFTTIEPPYQKWYITLGKWLGLEYGFRYRSVKLYQW